MLAHPRHQRRVTLDALGARHDDGLLHRMRDFVGGFPITAQQEGRWQRVGETRTPDHWFAWGEGDRRNGTARNVFGTDS